MAFTFDAMMPQMIFIGSLEIFAVKSAGGVYPTLSARGYVYEWFQGPFCNIRFRIIQQHFQTALKFTLRQKFSKGLHNELLALRLKQCPVYINLAKNQL